MDSLDFGDGANPSFDFFTSPKTDFRVQGVYYDELLPLAPISSTTTSLSFTSEPNPNFTDLASTKLELKFRLINPDGSKIKAAAPPPDPTLLSEAMPQAAAYYGCGVIQAPGFSLFKGKLSLSLLSV